MQDDDIFIITKVNTASIQRFTSIRCYVGGAHTRSCFLSCEYVYRIVYCDDSNDFYKTHANIPSLNCSISYDVC